MSVMKNIKGGSVCQVDNTILPYQQDKTEQRATPKNTDDSLKIHVCPFETDSVILGPYYDGLKRTADGAWRKAHGAWRK